MNTYSSYQQGFRDSAALCRRYALNLFELPQAKDAARECAALLDEAAELAPTVAETGDAACQYLLEHFFPSENADNKSVPR